MDQYTQRIVGGIIKELSKPQNADLLVAVRDYDLDNTHGGFVFGFTSQEPMNFDAFGRLTVQLDELIEFLRAKYPSVAIASESSSERLLPMFKRYELYLSSHNENMRLNLSQSKRLDAITARFDDGWSGAVYGMLMREVQHILLRMVNN